MDAWAFHKNASIPTKIVLEKKLQLTTEAFLPVFAAPIHRVFQFESRCMATCSSRRAPTS